MLQSVSTCRPARASVRRLPPGAPPRTRRRRPAAERAGASTVKPSSAAPTETTSAGVEAVEQRLRRSRRAPVLALIDRRHDRQRERAAELEGRVEQAAGEALLLRRDAARGRDVERPEREREAEAGEQERRQHRGRVARVEPDRQEQRVAGGDRRSCPATISRVTPKRAIERRDARRERPRRAAPPGKIASPVSSADQPRSCCM